jgi:hypothetical protein
MPLVVPGVQSEGGSGIEAWTNKLMGKKIGDNHDEVVRSPVPPLHHSI